MSILGWFKMLCYYCLVNANIRIVNVHSLFIFVVEYQDSHSQ